MKRKILALILCVLIIIGIGNSVLSQLSQPTVPTTATEQDNGGKDTDAESPESEGADDSDVGFIKLVQNKLKKPAQPTPIPVGQTVYCAISFETNGGSKIAPIQLQQGAKLDNLPTPIKLENIFAGWYYDAALSAPVKATDLVYENKTLYAAYQETAPLVASETPQFASMLDVGANFAITVLSTDTGMSAADVQAGIAAKNLTDPTSKDLIVVSGGNGRYVVSGKGGFVEGASFKIVLEDERLTYENFLPSVRNYNFTTAKAEVMNMQLATDMKYIAMEELRNIVNDGQQVESLSLALYQADSNGNISPADLTTGSFTYTGSQTFAVGDTVAVYAGLRPDLRTLESTKEENGALAYVTLTAVEGQQISYQNAAPEEVIFEPDMLPVSTQADTDDNENTITLENGLLDYSSDVYANIELDSQTTVDVGDFLVFYRGTFGESDVAVEQYAKITAVAAAEQTTTITYIVVDWATVQAAMDIYTADQVEGSEMLEGVDKEELEGEIEQQAVDSGFAEEAALYLASVAMATESFTELGDDIDLTDYRATLEDGTPLSPEELRLMGENDKVEVELSTLKAYISTNLKNFEGYSGLRLTLDVGVEITITPKDGSDNQIKITITGAFEQEVRIDIGVSSSAVWKVWGIFPYIAEYRISANVDLFDFTGIGIDATFVTAEKSEDDSWTENKEFKDLAKQMKDLMDAKDKYLGDGETSIADGLTDKYKKMLETESDWINLFEKSMFEKEFHVPPCLPIIAIKIEVKFVVSANAVVSLGFDFYYMNAKRYVYTIDVFASKVYNDVIDIQEETYEFTFYVMGTLGIRAGINASFEVGLFSTKFASVGFSAEVGAYARLWGYFYYELHYTASQGRTQSYCGALYVEVGVYLEVTFEAQAFGGTFSTEVSLYENEWPLWSIGYRDSIQDFTTEQSEMPSVKLKQYIRSTMLPDDIFSMTYLDLKEGEEEDALYDDQKNFVIEMSNKAFQYDPATNMVTVSPSFGDVKLEGEMKITWKTYPLAFTSKPIQRKITLYWDNLRDGYVIAPLTNGGSYLPIMVMKYEAPVTQPENPTRAGYVFGGWYADKALTRTYTFPKTMPAKDAEIYAAWTPATDTAYKVEHYQQVLGSSQYQLIETDALQGTTESRVTPLTKSYLGYSSPAKEELVIKADGSAVLRYYYNLKTHTVTFMPGEVGGENEVIELKFGATITAPQFGAKGYIFKGWNSEVAKTIGDDDLEYTAQWAKDTSTKYRAEYYVQQPDGSYKMQDVAYLTGSTGEELTDEALRGGAYLVDEAGLPIAAETRFAVENGVQFESMTVDGKNLTELETPAIIGGNGRTVVKINYSRAEYAVTFEPENGEEDVTTTLYYGAELPFPNLTRPGYDFVGWQDAAGADAPETMGTADATYTAQWTARTDTKYSVEYHVQQPDGTDKVYANAKQGETDTELTAQTLRRDALYATKDGVVYQKMTVNGNAAETATIAGDGKTLIAIYYERLQYKVTFAPANGGNQEIQTLYYGAQIPFPALTRVGYDFTGWKDAAQNAAPETVGTADAVYTAQWQAHSTTPYRVEHYVMNTDGSYPATATTTDYRRGTSDATLQTLASFKNAGLEVKDGIAYANATVDGKTVTSAVIAADGTLVIKLYYLRSQYTLSWEFGEGTVNDAYTSGRVYYGAFITAPRLTRAGYTYEWNKAPATTMPAADTTYTAIWTGNPYTVVFDSATGTGSMPSQRFINGAAQKLTANAFAKQDYDFVGWALSAGAAPVYQDAQSVMDLVDKYNGSMTLYACWKAHPYVISYVLGGGTNSPTNPVSHTVEDAAITLGAPTRAGYTFAGWYADAAYQGQAVTEIAAGSGGDLNLYARWTANTDTTYAVEHLLQEIGSEAYLVKNRESFTGTTDTKVTPAVAAYEGFTAPAAQTVSIAGDGKLVVQYRYTRNPYTLQLAAGEGTLPGEAAITAQYGQTIALPTPTRAGYGFAGWYLDAAYAGEAFTHQTMPATSATLYAKWEAGRYGYTVNHYKMNLLGSGYDLAETVRATANMDESVTPGLATYAGFTAPAAQTVTITTDPAANTVNYYYTRNQYKLAWDLAGGSAAEGYTSGDVFYDTAITAPQPVRAGYRFAWSETPVLTMPDRNLSYTANWTANNYTVSFDANGGSSAAERTVTYDTAYGELPVTTRAGYTFDGWYTARTGGSKVESGTLLTTAQNHTLYAHWNTITYTITYAGMKDAHNENPASYTVETAITLAQPTRTGYTFTGWTTEGQDTPIRNLTIPVGSIGNKTYTANWSINQYTLTFMTHDGVYTTIEQNYATAITAPEAPTRRGYLFTGWDKQIPATMPAEGKTFTANWKLVTYAVHYENLMDGQNSPNNPASYSVVSEDLLLYSPTRTGYAFAGWYAQSDFGGNRQTQIKAGGVGDITLYAKWIANSYTVNFEANATGVTGTTQSQSFVYDTAQQLTATGFARAGYTFAGWATSATGSKVYADAASVKNLSSAADGSVTLYAVWTPVTYQLTYALDGGTLEQANPASYTTESETFVLYNPTKVGYTFTGWTTGDETEPNTAMVVVQGSRGDKAFTAQWEINQYTITFASAGGSQVEPLTFDYGATVTAPAQPTRKGYAFTGWDPVLPQTMPANHLTVTAKWTAVPYTVTYHNMDGAENSPDNPQQFTVESGILTLNPPSKTGYGFGGWYLDEGFTKPIENFTTSTISYNLHLYAKWEANSYSISFDNNLKAGHATQTQLFRYDTAQALTTNSFTNTGYSFQGWTTVQNSGRVDYADSQVVQNLATAGNVTLYAVWKPVTYSISYSVGVGASGHGNPTSYNIETAEIRLANPSGQRPGYQFLGWYEGDTKVTAIQHGTTGNRTLTAKWAHGGTFSLSMSGSSNGTTTYVITRTIPAGAQATSDVQNVYYRTLNGTAIGGTAQAIHFLHVGGPEVFATFTASDGNGSTKTFTVTGENANAEYNKSGTIISSTAYGTSSAQRYYEVVIYKVLSTQNNCTGVLGANMLHRSISWNNEYSVEPAMYNTWHEKNTGFSQTRVTDAGWKTAGTVGLYAPLPQLSSKTAAYLQRTATKVGFGLIMDEYEESDGYQWIGFDTNTGISDTWRFQTDGSVWNANCYVPTSGSTGSGGKVYDFSHQTAGLTFNGAESGYLEIPTNVSTITIKVDASGSGYDDWHYRNVRQRCKVFDTREPSQVGMAPMAFGVYKAGDTVSFSVVYDEIVNNRGNATFGSVSGMPLSNVTYTSGIGTSVLHFTATAASDFEITPNFNDTLINTKPMNGTVYDMAG